MELYLPYAPVAAAVSEDVRTLTITLVLGLAAFYAVLFRLIAAASKRLQRQAEELRDSADRDRHQATHDALTGLPNWELLRDRLEQGAGRRHPLRRRDRAAADRPGPLQGDQRQPRPHLRRQAALPGRPAAAVGAARRRHRRPAGRRRVRRPAAVGRRRRRGPGGRRAAPRGAAPPLRRRRRRPRRRGQHRHRALAVARHRHRGPAAQRRHRDVRGQGAQGRRRRLRARRARHRARGGSPCSATCAARWRAPTSSSSTTSPSSPWTASGSRASRRCCAGSTRPQGLIPPGEFIPVAEGTGIILRLTERVLDLALAQMRRWLDAGHAVPVAVNLSTRCLLDAGLPDLVAAAARRAPGAGRRCCASRSPRAPSWATPPAAWRSCSGCTTSACGCRSTTSAPATARWPTCAGCRSTSSRSTARSCSA